MSASDEETGAGAEPSFEELLGSLDELVTKLERGDLPLEEALAAFERGVALSDRAEAILAGAEMKVARLLEQRDGTTREEPLADDG